MPKRDFDDLSVFGGSHLSEKRTLAWKVCGFANLQHERGEKIAGIGSCWCHGHEWTISVYPRGDNSSSNEEDHISTFLRLTNLKEGQQVTAKFTVRVGNHSKSLEKIFCASSTKTWESWGCSNFMKRDLLLGTLEKGALLIEVDIHVYMETSQPLLPRSTLSRNYLKMLESGKRTDVTFVVEDEKVNVHYCVLAVHSPILAELAEDTEAAGKDIVIENISAPIFHAMLRFVYAEEHPPDELLEQSARDLLDAADRFGCSNLKLIAESKLVESELKPETAAELLLLADGRSCALLKEAALDYIKGNAAAVMDSPGWSQIEKSPSLMSEVMKVTFKHKTTTTYDSDPGQMTVTELRRQLQQEGQSEDGTKEILIQRLKEAAAKRRRLNE